MAGCRRVWEWGEYVTHLSVEAGLDPVTARECTLDEIRRWAEETIRQRASDRLELLVAMQLASATPHSKEAGRACERLAKELRQMAQRPQSGSQGLGTPPLGQVTQKRRSKKR